MSNYLSQTKAYLRELDLVEADLNMEITFLLKRANVLKLRLKNAKRIKLATKKIIASESKT